MMTMTKPDVAVQLPLKLGLPVLPTLPSTLDEERLTPEILAGLFALHNVKPRPFQAIVVTKNGDLLGCALGALVEHEDIAYTPEPGGIGWTHLKTDVAIAALQDTGKYSWFFLIALVGGFDGSYPSAEVFFNRCDDLRDMLDEDDHARMERGFTIGQATRVLLDAAGA